MTNIRWMVYYQVHVRQTPTDKSPLAYDVKNVELGRVTAANRGEARKAAARRWPRRGDLCVQSEASAAIDGAEEVVGTSRRYHVRS